MATKLFVGSLSYSATDDDLSQFFASAGTVASAKVIVGETGLSNGFGFVEMISDADAAVAIKQLNGKELNGRAVVVNEARPREER
jgi:RNA recognition motif-containing protein